MFINYLLNFLCIFHHAMNLGFEHIAIYLIWVFISPSYNLFGFFSEGHDEDILCLSISPNRLYIATGEKSM